MVIGKRLNPVLFYASVNSHFSPITKNTVLWAIKKCYWQYIHKIN